MNRRRFLRRSLTGAAALWVPAALGQIYLPNRRQAFKPVAGGGTFSPSDVAGLRLWYKADAITGKNEGDQITSWVDSSGNGFNLSGSGTNTVYDASDPSANNMPAVVCTSSSNNLAVSLATSNVCNSNVQYIFVVRSTGAIDQLRMWVLLHSSVTNHAQENGGYIYWDSTDTSGGRLSVADSFQSTFSVWEFVRDGVNMDITQDGTALASKGTATGTLASETATFKLLDSWNARGSWFEFLCYNQTVSSSDRASIRGYLKTKYGTP